MIFRSMLSLTNNDLTCSQCVRIIFLIDTRIDYMKGAIMEEKKYTADGMNIEVDKYEDKKIRERRIMAYAFKMIREESGMNRKDFAEWLGIPYRTMQEWELGRRAMPKYVLDLISYKVQNEKKEGRI